MKFLSFLRWKCRQTTIEDIFWYSGALLVGIGVSADFNKTFIAVGILFWCGMFVNILVRHYRKEYQNFIEEQNGLFETIKHSDKNDL